MSNSYVPRDDRRGSGVEPFDVVLPANPDEAGVGVPTLTGVDPLAVYVRAPVPPMVVGELPTGVEALEEFVPALPRRRSALGTASVRTNATSGWSETSLAT